MRVALAANLEIESMLIHPRTWGIETIKIMNKKDKKPSNLGVAVYLANKHGNDVSDEIIIKAAKILGMYPKVLLRNYKFISQLNKMFEDFNA